MGVLKCAQDWGDNDKLRCYLLVVNAETKGEYRREQHLTKKDKVPQASLN
jgi:hypothetical protein